jgi:phosphoesterase RecJ-like protein
MSSLLYEKVQEHIATAGHILLLTDERIDGDTMGSTMGLFHVLKDLGKKVEVFSPKPLPQSFKFIPGIDVIRRDAEVFLQPSIDLVIISDCSDGEYIKKFLPTMPHKVPLISFDHHATNPMYGTINVVEPTAASTADVVWRFVKNVGYAVSPEAAQCFLTGIYTDTNVFSTANTTTAALEASTELVKLGADPKIIVRNHMMNRSVSALRLWGLVFGRLFHDPELDAVATAITRQDLQNFGATDEDLKSISNFLNEMLEEKHDVVVVYVEKGDGSVKGSLRSRNRDVAKLAAEKYGGGGHKLAAGFKIPNSKLVEKDGRWVVEKISGV